MRAGGRGLVALLLALTGCSAPARVAALPPACPGSSAAAYAYTTANDSTVDIVGVGPTGVAALTDDGRSSSPSFTPDGRSIVFARSDVGAPTASSPAAASTVWIMGSDRSQPRELLRMAVVDSVSVSPEGTRLAIIGQTRAYRPDSAVYVAGIDGGGLRRVYAPPNDGQLLFGDPPAWSPDGTEVAVVITANGRFALYAIGTADGAWRSVTEVANASDPSWSADGSTLSFVSSVPRRGQDPRVLFTVDAAGGQPQPRVFDVESATASSADGASWLGHREAFTDPPSHELVLVDTDGVVDRMPLPPPDIHVGTSTLAPCALR